MQHLRALGLAALLLVATLLLVGDLSVAGDPGGGDSPVDLPGPAQTPPAGALLAFETPVPPAGPPDTNPYTVEWLAANHGLYDNKWTALYEQQSQAKNPAGASPGQEPSLAPLATDVRMSNGSFNSAQYNFQIDINPMNPLFALGAADDNLTAGVGLYRTSDGGATWTPFDAPIGTAACCNPSVAYAANGTVYVSVGDSSPQQTYVISSSNNGATWSAPVTLAALDRAQLVVDNGPSSPYTGTVYMTYSDVATSRRIKAFESTDGGVTWSSSFFVSGAVPASGYHQAGQPYVASNGTLYVGYQEYENTSLGCGGAPVRNWLARSTNGGTSFSQYQIGGAPITQGGVCLAAQAGRGIFCVNGAGNYFRSRSHPIVSGDPNNPNIVYVVYSGGDLETAYSCAGGSGFHSDILFVKSTDGGVTWGPKIKINGDPPGKDQYLPWINVSPNGMLWVGWHDRREDASNYQHRWYQAYSSDQGATWHEYPVADVLSLPNTTLGNYAGIAAASNRVLGMWWDSRIKTTGDPYTEPTIPPPMCSQPCGPWTTGAQLPAGVYGSAVASDGVYVYAAGGYGSGGVANQLARYDPVANTWTSLAPLPTPVYESLAVLAEGKLFIFGGLVTGSNAISATQIYSISANTWATGASMPAARRQAGGGYHNGKIYVVGGYETGLVSPQNQTWEYNLGTNTWATKANLPAALGGPGFGMVDGHLYILGGRDASHAALDTVYDYNIAANTWTARPPMPTAVNYPASAVYRGRIWLVGGGTPFLKGATTRPSGVETTGITQIFDPATGAWLPGPALNTARSFAGAAAVRNKIVVAGGWIGSGETASVEVATQPPLRILILHSDALNPGSLQLRLSTLPGVGAVDTWNERASSPTLAALQAYDVVVAYSNYPWDNSATVGDLLADYVDSGGVVVGLNFAWSSSAYAVGGRWTSGGYSPFNTGGADRFITGTLGVYSTDHPLMAGVTALNAYYRQTLTLATGATMVATWNDGDMLLAYKGRAIGMSAYLGDSPNTRYGGDFARVIVNAGYWLRRGDGPCTALTCQRPTTFTGSITAGDPLQNGRLERSEPASTCAAPQVCSVNDATPRHYDAYPFMNNDDAEQCVTVTIDAGTCVGTQYLSSAAYLGSYDPANLCGNYLADIGGSPNPIKSYSFNVPAGQAYTVVVNEVNADTSCPAYTLNVSADSCPAYLRHIYLPVTLRNAGP